MITGMSQPALHGTACKVCRRRGRKCDRALPTCVNCEKRGVRCEGYVTRWVGVAARGKFAGKSAPVLEAEAVAPSSKQSHEGIELKPQSHNAVVKSHTLEQDSTRSETVYLSHPDQFDEADIDRLVGHYVEDLSSIFYLGDGPGRNPMFSYVLPLVDTVPPIRYALAASAACHTAARDSDETLDRKSLSLRVQATHLMRERLEDPSLTTYETMLPSILMLAQLDMCSGDCTEFETHMQAGVAMCRDSRADHASNNYYFEQRLAWLDIISSTTSTRLPFFSVQELKTALGRLSTDSFRQWSYDVFPCPVDLCEMLVDTTILYKMQHRYADRSNDEMLVQADAIMRRLQSWTYNPSSAEGSREHMVEAWRLGIIAYLTRLFPEVPSGKDATSTKTLTAQILQHAKLIPPTTSWSFPLLWPIFQVAVSLDDLAVDEKTWIRGYLRRSLGAVGCRHFSNALDTLEYVWANHGQLGFSATGTFGRTIMLG